MPFPCIIQWRARYMCISPYPVVFCECDELRQSAVWFWQYWHGHGRCRNRRRLLSASSKGWSVHSKYCTGCNIVTNTNCVIRWEDDAEDLVVFDTLTCIPIYLWLLVINHALCTVAGGGWQSPGGSHAVQHCTHSTQCTVSRPRISSVPSDTGCRREGEGLMSRMSRVWPRCSVTTRGHLSQGEKATSAELRAVTAVMVISPWLMWHYWSSLVLKPIIYNLIKFIISEINPKNIQYI